MKYMFVDFINSLWHDWKGSGKTTDKLDNIAWIDHFLTEWNIYINQTEYTEIQAKLKKLRGLINSIIEKIIKEEPISQKDIKQLNSVMRNTLYRYIFDYQNSDRKLQESNIITDGTKPSAYYQLSLELEPAQKDIDWILTKITESFISFIVYDDIKRLKICANPDCRWLFIDESRGLTRNWCDSKICGNLMKVRRFRERKKQNND